MTEKSKYSNKFKFK